MSLKLKDIADRLNVSQATVSLALNNRPGVSQVTREKVLKAAKEMGYNMNMLSRPSSKGQGNIRFIIYKKHGKVVSDTPFFSALIEGIEQGARDMDYNLLISYVNGEGNGMDLLGLIKDRSLDGIILLATEMDVEDLNLFKQTPVPIVMLDSFFIEAKYDAVVINNVQGSYQAIQHLIDRGHSHIGYLSSSIWIKNFQERMNGFLKVLKANDIQLNPDFIFNLEPTLEGSYRDMSKILDTKPTMPTALFADNDIIAFGAIKAIKERGIKIPEDISLVAFDDMPFCEMVDPPLTTIKVYKQSMGRLAVRRLIDRMEGDHEATVKIEVNTELIERASVING